MGGLIMPSHRNLHHVYFTVLLIQSEEASKQASKQAA